MSSVLERSFSVLWNVIELLSLASVRIAENVQYIEPDFKNILRIHNFQKILGISHFKNILRIPDIRNAKEILNIKDTGLKVLDVLLAHQLVLWTLYYMEIRTWNIFAMEYIFAWNTHYGIFLLWSLHVKQQFKG